MARGLRVGTTLAHHPRCVLAHGGRSFRSSQVFVGFLFYAAVIAQFTTAWAQMQVASQREASNFDEVDQCLVRCKVPRILRKKVLQYLSFSSETANDTLSDMRMPRSLRIQLDMVLHRNIFLKVRGAATWGGCPLSPPRAPAALLALRPALCSPLSPSCALQPALSAPWPSRIIPWLRAARALSPIHALSLIERTFGGCVCGYPSHRVCLCPDPRTTYNMTYIMYIMWRWLSLWCSPSPCPPQVPFFKVCDLAQITALVTLIVREHVWNGMTIVTEDTVAPGLHMIMRGFVRHSHKGRLKNMLTVRTLWTDSNGRAAASRSWPHTCCISPGPRLLCTLADTGPQQLSCVCPG
jgi:hypothetical protein